MYGFGIGSLLCADFFDDNLNTFWIGPVLLSLLLWWFPQSDMRWNREYVKAPGGPFLCQSLCFSMTFQWRSALTQCVAHGLSLSNGNINEW